jgi:hypothetical protein
LARSTNTLARDELDKLFSRPINYSHGEMAWQLLVILAQSLRHGCYLIQFAHTLAYKHRFSLPNLTELDALFLIFSLYLGAQILSANDFFETIIFSSGKALSKTKIKRLSFSALSSKKTHPNKIKAALHSFPG